MILAAQGGGRATEARAGRRTLMWGENEEQAAAVSVGGGTTAPSSVGAGAGRSDSPSPVPSLPLVPADQ